MISLMGSLFARVLFRNRTTSVISALVIVALALFAWHKLDKRSAVREAVMEYVAANELRVARSQIAEANRRAAVAEEATRTLSASLEKIEAEATGFQSEIERYEAGLENLPACQPDDDFFDGLLTK